MSRTSVPGKLDYLSELDLAASTPTTGSLAERARAAAEEYRRMQEREDRERELRRQAERARDLANLLERRLDIIVDPVSDRMTVDGLTFTLRESRHDTFGHYVPDSLHLVRPCIWCGADVFSYDISRLSDLGFALEQEPVCFHGCGDVDAEGDGE